jgi:hypothetical protein
MKIKKFNEDKNFVIKDAIFRLGDSSHYEVHRVDLQKDYNFLSGNFITWQGNFKTLEDAVENCGENNDEEYFIITKNTRKLIPQEEIDLIVNAKKYNL